MAPKKKRATTKRKAKGKKSVKKKTKVERKRHTGSGSRSTTGRVRSAYLLYCADNRSQVLRRHGPDDVPSDFGEAARLLGRSWRELDDQQRCRYEALAAIDHHRVALAKLTKEARSSGDPGRTASAVREAVAALGRAPPVGTVRAAGSAVLAGAIEALEKLDRHSGKRLRAEVGAHLGVAAASPAASASLRQALGRHLGERLAMLLRRWSSGTVRMLGAGGGAPALSGAAPSPGAGTGSKRGRAATPEVEAPPPSGGADPVVAAGEVIRSKVVGALMRASARSTGRAALALCREIEQELYTASGSDTKAYKRRARSLAFNLGAADGGLLQRVLEGELPIKELVRLEGEDLASDMLKEQRREELDKYFRTEVQLARGLPQHRWELFREKSSDLLGEPSKLEPVMPDLASQGSEAEDPSGGTPSESSSSSGSASESETSSSKSGMSSSSSGSTDVSEESGGRGPEPGPRREWTSSAATGTPEADNATIAVSG